MLYQGFFFIAGKELRMSEKRKDNKGRILRTGEGQRKDGRYYFRWNTPDGKRHTEYANTLNELRDKEKEIERRRLLREDATDDIAPISIKNSDTEQGTEIQIAQITVERLNPKFCVNAKSWCKIEQNHFKAGEAQAAAALSIK